MSKSFSRGVVTLVSTLALCAACGSDQKTPETANDVQPDVPTPQPDDTGNMPNGQPTNTPPGSPPPQGLNDANTANAMASPGVTNPSSAPQLTEPQIAMITDLANTAEIEQGKLAQTKAKNPAVKKFAAMMIKHHTDAKADQAKVFKQLSLTPTQSQDATALKEDADKALGSMRGADGAAFDLAYIEAQVDEHQKVLNTIDQKLLPAAKSEDLVSGLKKMRETVESHLKEAKTIQADLSKTTSK